MKLSIIILTGFIFFYGEACAQPRIPSNVSEEGNEISHTESNAQKKALLKNKALDTDNEKEKGFLDYRDQMTNTLSESLTKRERKEEFHFNPIKSLNGNIKFGGLYNNRVDLYVAPDMFIKPFEGVSIYAIRKRHVYIPLEKIKENIPSLLLETLSLAAIENAVNYFTITDKVLNGILNFALKNGFTFLSQTMKEKDKDIPSWEYYYFSIGVRF